MKNIKHIENITITQKYEKYEVYGSRAGCQTQIAPWAK